MSAQRGLILAAMEQRGWGLRDLSAATAELREDGRGYTIGTLSAYFNNPDHEIRTRTLYHIALALEIPLRHLLMADGINVDTGQPVSGAHARHEKVRLMLEAAPDATLRRIERILKVHPSDMRALDAFLDSLEARHAKD